jgi:hypothetical protein
LFFFFAGEVKRVSERLLLRGTITCIAWSQARLGSRILESSSCLLEIYDSGSFSHCDESRMSTTSESVWPRSKHSFRPSGDQRKPSISSASNVVRARPFDPPSG